MAKADTICSKRTVVVPQTSQPGGVQTAFPIKTEASAESMDTQEASSSRMVVVPPAEGASNGASSILKCEVCDIEFNSPSHAEMHYQGKKHAKKVKLMIEGPTPPPG